MSEKPWEDVYRGWVLETKRAAVFVVAAHRQRGHGECRPEAAAVDEVGLECPVVPWYQLIESRWSQSLSRHHYISAIANWIRLLTHQGCKPPVHWSSFLQLMVRRLRDTGLRPALFSCRGDGFIWAATPKLISSRPHRP